MNKKELQPVAQAVAKNIKTEADLDKFRQMLTKITVETALNAELDDHLGIDNHEQSVGDSNRNGYASKTLQTESDQFSRGYSALQTRSFEPKLFKSTCADSPRWMTRPCSLRPGYCHPGDHYNLQGNVRC